MPDRTCITMSFPTPLFFRYHLPLTEFYFSLLLNVCDHELFNYIEMLSKKIVV